MATIDKLTYMNNSTEYELVGFTPESAGTTDQVLTKTASGYDWATPSEPTVVSDDSGVTYHITVSNSDPTAGTASNIITFVS